MLRAAARTCSPSAVARTPSTWRVMSVTPSCCSSLATRWRSRLIGSPSLSAAERKLPCSITCRKAWTFSQVGRRRPEPVPCRPPGGSPPRRRVCMCDLRALIQSDGGFSKPPRSPDLSATNSQRYLVTRLGYLVTRKIVLSSPCHEGTLPSKIHSSRAVDRLFEIIRMNEVISEPGLSLCVEE